MRRLATKEQRRDDHGWPRHWTTIWVAVTALLACQRGGGETSATTDPETAESSASSGSGTTTDGSLNEGDSSSSGSSTTEEPIDRCACPAELAPSCDHLDIGCLDWSGDICDFTCATPELDGPVLTCWLNLFASGKSGYLEWTDSIGSYGGRAGAFVLNGDGTIITTEWTWCGLGIDALGSFLRELRPDSYFQECLALVTDVERLSCLSAGIYGEDLEVCVLPEIGDAIYPAVCRA